MKKIFLLSSLAFILLLATKDYVYSQSESTCPAIYNGGEICKQAKDFSTNKTIKNPNTNAFVDRILPGEASIYPGATLIFKIEITNTSNKTLKNITVKDTLPSFAVFSKADKKVDSSKQTLTYKIPSIEKGKKDTTNIELRLADADLLPTDSSFSCVSNRIEAKLNIQTGSDLVTFCINKQEPTQQTQLPSQNFTNTVPVMTKGGQTIFPQPQTNRAPNTGPEAIALIGLIPALLGGFYFRKISK